MRASGMFVLLARRVRRTRCASDGRLPKSCRPLAECQLEAEAAACAL